MRIIPRWRKRPQRNVLFVDASLIREVVNDHIDFSIPASLYDYVYEVDDETLDWLGGEILNDPDVWLTLTDTIIAYVTSLKFTEILDEGGVRTLKDYYIPPDATWKHEVFRRRVLDASSMSGFRTTSNQVLTWEPSPERTTRRKSVQTAVRTRP
jgi:hypothetical protein